MTTPAKHPQWLTTDDLESKEPAPKRLLLLTQVFPPHSDVGAARWEGFAPYLSSAGFALDVITEDPAAAFNPDWERVKKLPAGTRVAICRRRQPAWYMLLRKRRTQGKGVGSGPIPPATPVSYVGTDGFVSKVKSLVSAVIRAQQSRSLAKEFTISANAIVDFRHCGVVSSGPSHYVHVAAYQVCAERRLPHIVDLRDPWGPGNKSLGSSLIDENLCRHSNIVMTNAALVITNTDSAREVLIGRLPAIAGKVVAIPNGSDLQPIVRGEPPPTIFQIAHCGTLYIDRDPRPFFRAVGSIRSRLGLHHDNFRIVFMGEPAHIGGKTLTECAEEAGVADLLEERLPGTRDQARNLLLDSVMAIAFQGATKTQIPAKLFEYVAFPVWLLALVGRDTASSELLKETSAHVLDIADTEGIARAMEECYLAYKNGHFPQAVGADGRFSREHQAEELVKLIRGMIT